MSQARFSVDRQHSLSGRDTLDWFFANRKWVRFSPHSLVEAAWAKRPLPETECAIRFLLLAPKRSYKRAHDRNKIKRWLRAAISEVPELTTLETELASRSKQLLVMLRISKPIKEVEWGMILENVYRVGEHLKKQVGKPSG